MTFLKNNVKKIAGLLFALLLGFSLTACNDKEDTQKVQEGLASIAVGNLNNLTESFELRATTIQHDLPITWEVECTDGSAKIETINSKIMVTITRSEYSEDANKVQNNPWGEAKLKATVTVGKQSSTRDWDMFIKPGDKPAEALMSLATIKAATMVKDSPVLTEATVFYVKSDGYMVIDETDTMFVYTESAPASTIVPGAVVQISGKKDIYYSMPQIASPITTIVTAAPAAGFDYSVATVEDIDDIEAKLATDPLNFTRLYKATGTIVAVDVYSCKFALKDPVTNGMLYIHYSSNANALTEVQAKVGDYVSMVLLAYEFHSSYKVWRYMAIAGTIVDAEEPVLTDQEIVDNSKTELTASFNNKSYAFDLVLPATATAGATLIWSSSNTAVIANDGKFTMPAADTTITLTVTVTSNAVSENLALTVTAKHVAKQTVSEVITALNTAAAAGNALDFVMFEGIIVGADKSGYYYVADANAAIYVRQKLSADSLKVGDSVRVIGKAQVYLNTNKEYTRQVSGNYKVVKLDELTHDCPLTLTDVALTDFDFTITTTNFLTAVPAEELYGKLVRFDLYVIKVVDGSYTDYYLAESLETGAAKIKVHYNSVDLTEIDAVVGTKVKVTGIIYNYVIATGWALGFLGRDGDIEIPATLSETEKIAIAKTEIDAIVKENDNVTANLGFITDTAKAAILGAKYTWTTDDLVTLTAAGVFTAPVADKVVKITVSLFLDGNVAGTANQVWDINVNAKAIVVKTSTVIISQAYGGGGNSGATLKTDFIELYNTTDQAIDLSGWMVFYASKTGDFKNQADFTYGVSVPLSGSIAAHSFYLIKCADGAGGTVDLPTPDAPIPTLLIAMGGDGFKIALCNSTVVPTAVDGENVVDFVGASSTASLYEGEGPAPAPSNTLAIVRATLTDTDDNAADFVTAAPNPRNSASPAQ
ncbi:MAG: lamin tail domain-containing protein [Bacilli bacterium]